MMTRVPTFDGGERAAMAFADPPYKRRDRGSSRCTIRLSNFAKDVSLEAYSH